MLDISSKYPNFFKIVQAINANSPLQKKKLENYFSRQDEIYFHDAERFASDYIRYLGSQSLTVEYAVTSYLQLCSDMIKAQIFFMKTGRYPVNSSSDAVDTIYSDENKMKAYMVGLALSQFLWSSHYKIYRFFEDYIEDNNGYIHSYLEVGPGHGLFLRKAMDFLDEQKKITVVEISPVSLNITRSIVAFFKPHRTDIICLNEDILTADLVSKYDFIVMGEVLEHVDCPERLLLKINNLLDGGGNAFISTCANCPAADHVYHFKTVEQIRELIYSCGFEIKNELVLPVEELPMQEIIEKNITINYCAIIHRGGVQL